METRMEIRWRSLTMFGMFLNMAKQLLYYTLCLFHYTKYQKITFSKIISIDSAEEKSANEIPKKLTEDENKEKPDGILNKKTFNE